MQAGRDVRDRCLTDLIGELSTRSDEFATRWARQNVRIHRTTRKRLHNQVIGDIELTGDALELPGDDLVLIAYTADPGQPPRSSCDSSPPGRPPSTASWRRQQSAAATVED